MKTSRISNALGRFLLSTLLAFGGALYAEPSETNKDQKAYDKEKARYEREAQRQEKPGARTSRPQPAKPRQPAAEPVTFLGVAAQPVGEAVRAQLALPAGTGIAVGDVLKDSPAENAGIRKFDVLTKLDDQILISGEQLQTLVRMKKPGDQITLTLLRASKEKTVKVKLTSHRFPAHAMQRRDFPADSRWPHPGTRRPWGQHSWEDHWKDFGEKWGRSLDDWMEKHGSEWEQRLREFMDENFGDPDTWEPKMKKWLENEIKPQLESHVRSFAHAEATIIDDKGKVVIRMKDGKKHVTVYNAQGNMEVTGFCETDAERKKFSKDVLKKVDSVKLDVRIEPMGDLKVKPEKPEKPSPKKGGGKKDDAV